MNAIAAIAAAFLRGEVLTIKSAFKDFGVSNLPRECGRAIERKFGVRLAKVRKDGKSRWGVPCSWFEYRLPTTDYNQEGIKRMQEYVKKQADGHEKASGIKVREHTRNNSKPQQPEYTNKLF